MDFTEEIVEDKFARYKTPIVEVLHLKKNKGQTQIVNLKEISDVLGRPGQQILSYVQRKLATCRTGKNALQGIHDQTSIQKMLVEYIQNNVLCGTCKNPETVPDGDGISCKACGKKTIHRR